MPVIGRHIRATPKCSNRLFEWVSAVMMIQIGMVILISHHIFDAKPQLAFKALLELGLSETIVGIVFFVFGIVRAIALRMNGSWVLGPHIRIVGAAVALFIWGQLFFGIVNIWIQTGDVYLSWGVWDSLLLGELFSIRRAILDINRPMDVIAQERL